MLKITERTITARKKKINTHIVSSVKDGIINQEMPRPFCTMCARYHNTKLVCPSEDYCTRCGANGHFDNECFITRELEVIVEPSLLESRAFILTNTFMVQGVTKQTTANTSG